LPLAEAKIFDIREKYQILLLRIETLKAALDEEVIMDERELKEAIDEINKLAGIVAEDLRLT
jgi:hypothetical protein